MCVLGRGELFKYEFLSTYTTRNLTFSDKIFY